MGLSLRIENMTTLPDGGPLAIDVPGKGGIDIGRDQHLDWTLPDPTRFISGKHCEIRFADGAYWLHDVSTNGTFLNGAEERMRSPHRLRSGDRLEIGDYIVLATVVLDAAAAAQAEPPKPFAPSSGQDLWHIDEEVAPPMRVAPMPAPRRDAPAPTDFLDHLVDSVGPAADALWNDGPQSARPIAASSSAAFDWRDASYAEGPRARSASPGLPRMDFAPPAPSENGPSEARLSTSASIHQAWPEDGHAEVAIDRSPSTPAGRSVPETPPAPPPAEMAPLPPAPANVVSADIIRAVAKGAGVPEAVFARYDQAQLAEELGNLIRITAANLQQLLSARSELKDVVRSSSHTTIVKADNNPLKFSPSVEEAIRLMFAPASGSYLGAARAIEGSFNDLKQHQGQIFAAIQGAVGMIQRDFDPKTIEAEVEGERGLGSLVASRKAKLWDAYVTRWRLGISRHDNGFLGVFLHHFAASYDRARGDR